MTEALLTAGHTEGDHHDENIAKLRRMAEQIADFFKSYPEEEAAASIADHINQFWSRRMREDFLAAFTADSQELHPLVRRALAQVRPPRTQGG